MKAGILPPEISIRIAGWQILRQSLPCLSFNTADLRLGFTLAVGKADSVGIGHDVIAHDGNVFR